MPIVLLYSCEKKTKDTTEKNREQKIDSINIKNITLKPKYDLETVILTDDNVVDFLTWYGERNPENKVLIETKFGNIEVELFDKTPLHRANFIYLVKKTILTLLIFIVWLKISSFKAETPTNPLLKR
nr:peptidylprolyl isomerase [Flavobacterium piscinae]